MPLDATGAILRAMNVDALPLGDAQVVHVAADFDPDKPLRAQLSALSEHLLELRLPGGRRCVLGWVPERSPAGAFRIELDGREQGWAEDWSGARTLLESLLAC